jgi:predicted nucleic-acid-binding protein
MIGIDTNVLLRAMIRDDEVQAARAEALLRAAQSRNELIVVSLTVVLEAVWALRRSYKLKRNDVVTFLDRLTSNRAIHILDRDIVVAALGLYRSSSIDFADVVIGLRATMEGADEVFSFDTDAIEAGLFSPVP